LVVEQQCEGALGNVASPLRNAQRFGRRIANFEALLELWHEVARSNQIDRRDYRAIRAIAVDERRDLGHCGPGLAGRGAGGQVE
jgi:hypothetical protein